MRLKDEKIERVTEELRKFRTAANLLRKRKNKHPVKRKKGNENVSDFVSDMSNKKGLHNV